MRLKYLLLILVLLSSIVYANDGLEEENTYYIEFIIASCIIITIISVYSVKSKKLNNKKKILLFTLICLSAIFTTVYLSYSTISLNINSVTKGPVHWHTDFEIWACGQKLDLNDPVGFFNRVGTPLLHEHNDDRIHIEGVVTELEDISLGNFFKVINLEVEDDHLHLIDVKLGDIIFNECKNKKAKSQVFLYKVKNPEDYKKWKFKQTKLENYKEYIVSGYSQVPPGDCIIIDFDEDKQQTNHICETYKVGIKKGELSGS